MRYIAAMGEAFRNLRSLRASAPAMLGVAFSASLSLLLTPFPARAQAPEPALKTLTFTPTSEDFPNPERGFYRYREMQANNDFDVRKDGNTLLFYKLRADAFRAAPFDKAFLDRFQHACDQARLAGVKLIPRVAYNDGPEAGCTAIYGCDAPKAIVMQQIAQLAPLWKKNKDVIDLIDPGFIAGWGEWHSSSNGLDNTKDETDILFAILDSLPPDRMVYVRYPRLKRVLFGGNATSDAQALKPAQAFDRSRVARVGHFNDCFLSGSDDVGTYKDISNGWPRARELTFIGGESMFTPYGGETCATDAKGACANALAEMATLHIDHLNRDYHPDVIQRWKTEGCYDSIARSLGYRFVLSSARLPDSVKPGGILRLEFTLRNQGFGELFNPRPVEVTLSGPANIVAVLPEDPRLWMGGTEISRAYRFSLPANLPEGGYTVGLRLPDADTALAKNTSFSIRFANEGMNLFGAGINILKQGMRVSSQAPGAANPAFTRFEVITDGTRVREPSGRNARHSSSWSAWMGMESGSPAARDLRGNLRDLRGRALHSQPLQPSQSSQPSQPLRPQ